LRSNPRTKTPAHSVSIETKVHRAEAPDLEAAVVDQEVLAADPEVLDREAVDVQVRAEVMRQLQSIRMILGTLVIAMIANTAFAQRGYVPAGRTEASPISTDKGFLFIDGEYVPPP
jgi:hypothetical protein